MPKKLPKKRKIPKNQRVNNSRENNAGSFDSDSMDKQMSQESVMKKLKFIMQFGGKLT